MFIQLTHYYSGERTFVLASSIYTVREKEVGKTLIIPSFGDGMYVKEEPYLIMNMIESVIGNKNYLEEESNYVQMAQEG